MDSGFLQEMAIAATATMACLVVGRAILAHTISRRWNSDWDDWVSWGPLYLLPFIVAALGVSGGTAITIGVALGFILLALLLKLTGRTLPQPHNEPLPPLTRTAKPQATFQQSSSESRETDRSHLE